MYFRDNMFMISCPARSGSTMLVHLLRSHPDIWCNGEVFGTDPVQGLLGSHVQRSQLYENYWEDITLQRDRDPARFLYKYVLDTQARSVAGFKLKSDEMLAPQYEEICNVVASDTDLKIILLHRNNLLDRYVSHRVAMHTGVTL